MDFIAKLPELADDALTNLGDNAERLSHSGTPKQRQAAQELLPAIQAEMAARLAKKPAKATKKRPAKASAESKTAA